MIFELLFLLFVIGVGFLVKSLAPEISISQIAVYALGLIMLSGYLAGRIVRRFKLPVVSGYLFMGLILGPHFLNLVTRWHIADLQALNGLALSLIALTAGGEIKWKGLKENFRSLSGFVLLQLIFIVIGMVLVIGSLSFILPFFSDTALFPGLTFILAAALLIGIVSGASSPAVTLAVIVESRLKNRITEMILSVLMLKDIFILFLFVIGLGVSRSVFAGVVFDASNLLAISLELVGSLAAGALIGLIIVLFLKYVKRDTVIFILSVCFFGYEIFEPIHLHPLLIMIVAGFIVENFSKEGDKMIHTLEEISPPVYIIFFTLTGAALNISFLKIFWLATIILSLLRMGFIFSGAYAWAKLVKETPLIKNNFWMAFISQAGLTLGMSKIIEANLPEPGQQIASLIISILIVNLVTGPLLLKLFIDKSKKFQPPTADLTHQKRP